MAFTLGRARGRQRTVDHRHTVVLVMLTIGPQTKLYGPAPRLAATTMAITARVVDPVSMNAIVLKRRVRSSSERCTIPRLMVNRMLASSSSGPSSGLWNSRESGTASSASSPVRPTPARAFVQKAVDSSSSVTRRAWITALAMPRLANSPAKASRGAITAVLP